MGLFGFGRQPGDSLGRPSKRQERRWETMSDEQRKRAFYKERAREHKAFETRIRKAEKAQRKLDKMEKQRTDWERKAKWMAARNKLEEQKRKRKKNSLLGKLARAI